MRDERNKAKTKIVSCPRSQKQKEDVHFVVDEKGKYIYIARTGAVSSSPRPPPPPTGTIFVARFVVVVGVCLW